MTIRPPVTFYIYYLSGNRQTDRNGGVQLGDCYMWNETETTLAVSTETTPAVSSKLFVSFQRLLHVKQNAETKK